MDRRTLPFTLAGVVVLLDRITKIWIESRVSFQETIPVIPGFFQIIHTRNRGMAFGLFSEGSSGFRTVLLVGVALVVLLLVAGLIWKLPRRAPAHEKFTAAALGLILGGAVGNLYDRVLRGSVTDFLDVHAGDLHWPAFNVADSAITIGAVLVALDLLRRPAKTD